jgi:hypothetical protein
LAFREVAAFFSLSRLISVSEYRRQTTASRPGIEPPGYYETILAPAGNSGLMKRSILNNDFLLTDGLSITLYWRSNMAVHDEAGMAAVKWLLN